jgi:hypothetical protein
VGTLKFRYALDPLCLLACACYLVNRFLLKPHFPSGFWHNHANDLLLIPAALPWLLWLQRKLRLRLNDDFPNWREISLHLVVWSVLFEGIGPCIMEVTGDWRDVVAYAAGAGLAGAWWQWRGRP